MVHYFDAPDAHIIAWIGHQQDEALAMADKVETWNTGRLYSSAGQRIAAALVNGVVYFADADRGIDGEYRPLVLPSFDLRRSVMARYDANDYRAIIRNSEIANVLYFAATKGA